MINWNEIKHFKPSEFPENPDKYADPLFIKRLDEFRHKLGFFIWPSPLSGALARTNGSETSMHYAVGRKSTAIDIFCEGPPIEAFTTLIQSNHFKGIGIYLDTDGPDGLPWIMFHIDTRPKGYMDDPLFWIAKKTVMKGKKVNKYLYPQLDRKHWSLLNTGTFFASKEFGVT